MPRSQVLIRLAQDYDRQALAYLFYEGRVHRHLDWRPPLDWLGRQPYLVAEVDAALRAALVCPPEPAEVAWIRLFAVSSRWSVDEAWKRLWPEAREQLHQLGDPQVVVLPMQSWFCNLLDRYQFRPVHQVIFLLRESRALLPSPKNQTVTIRSMRGDDLSAVANVDTAAFGPIWRNSQEALELAFEQSWIATVAELDGELVGYQISTPSSVGAHLARLAVRPTHQNQGIGYALLWNLVEQYRQRQVHRLTVNTQSDNSASLALYEKAGFRRGAESYPVYQYCPSVD